MMALLLPQWSPPESLHRLANVRRQRSRKSARATHGATQSGTSTKTSTDHFKIPSTESCCNLISPLVMTPRKPVRRSSRLRVRRESREDVKTDTETDMDAAEWYNRVLANNGVVEVDPVTMAEHMKHAKYYQADSNNNNTYYQYGSTSEAPDVYPSRSPGFPARVPLGVALAAGSAVALAIIALLVQALHKESDGTNSNSSDSEGSNLTSSFKGKPVAPDLSSKVSHQARDSKEVSASAAATGASFFNILERNKTPSPPSLSKGEKSWSESKYASVTPFFGSDRSTTSYTRPAPPPVSSEKSWSESKYASVTPFFGSDRSTTSYTRPAPPPVSSEKSWSESKYTSVTPFFGSDRSTTSYTRPAPPPVSSEKSWSESKYASVTPFFGSDRSTTSYTRPAPPPVSSEKSWSESKYTSVTPFFGSDRSTTSYTRPAPPPVSSEKSWSESKYASVTPFFGSDRSTTSYTRPAPPPVSSEKSWSESKYASVTPFFGSDTSTTSYTRPAPPPVSSEKSWSESKYASVTPFFGSDTSTISYTRPAPPPVSRWEGDKYKSVRPFFPDEVAASTETVGPSFSDEQGGQGKNENGSSANKTVTPFFADDQQGSINAKGSASLQNVPSFFPDEQQSKNGPSLESVAPFFADEQQGRNSTGVSQSEGTVKVENVKPFFPDEQVVTGSGSSRQSSSGSMWSQFWDGRSTKRDSSAASPKTMDLRGEMHSEGKQMLREIAGKPQGQHIEFMKGTTEERLAPNTSGAFSFQSDKEAPGVARPLSSDELSFLEDIKAEEERRFAKMQALQAAFPALAIGAGAVGALVGVDGAFEMVGITATASFISYELLWANKRQELVDEITSITDHHKLFNFLQKRKIVKDDC